MNWVIEAKGIYSIEKFIVARRLMYWEVYLHKTVVSAECLLINILKRAERELYGNLTPPTPLQRRGEQWLRTGTFKISFVILF